MTEEKKAVEMTDEELKQFHYCPKKLPHRFS